MKKLMSFVMLVVLCAVLVSCGSEMPDPSTYLFFHSENPFSITTGSYMCNILYTATPQKERSWATSICNHTMPAGYDKSRGEYVLYLRGENNTAVCGYNYTVWTYDASAPLYCDGNIMVLLDYRNPNGATMDSFCFYALFKNCTWLASAPELPALTMKNYCYGCMFYGCTSLVTAPDLPATTLASDCYGSMFNGCTSLKNIPDLPVANLASYCYGGMFYNCTSLETPMESLPATTLVDSCYRMMFSGCTSLKSAPSIAATILGENSLYYMFERCSSLKIEKVQEGSSPTQQGAHLAFTAPAVLGNNQDNSPFYGCSASSVNGGADYSTSAGCSYYWF